MSLTTHWVLLALMALPLWAGSARADPIASSIVKITAAASTPDLSAPWHRSSPFDIVGSGVVSRGHRILTNAHVVADQVHLEVQRGGVGKRFRAQVEHVCNPCDLAILSVEDERFFDGVKPMKIGVLPKPKQPVRVYGFPEGGEGLSVTEGVVSRIEFGYYGHSWWSGLIVQIDAAINSGNSGGPVVSDGEVVGISMQSLESAENIGDIVPAPIIKHFLDDIEDGRFDGFPELGVLVQTLENPALRKRLGLPDDSRGVLVTGVSRRDSAHNVIRPGDVILSIDGVPLLADNMVELENGIRLSSSVVEHRRQVGDEISVSLMRDGKEISIALEARAPAPLVPLGDFNRSPDYRIFGGLVFQALSTRYLNLFEEWPDQLAGFWADPSAADYEILGVPSSAETRREVVVLTGLLTNELTRGYEGFVDEVVHAINGEPIQDLAHLSSVLDHASDDFVTISMERGGAIAIDRARAKQITSQLLKRYQVAADRSPRLALPAAQQR